MPRCCHIVPVLPVGQQVAYLLSISSIFIAVKKGFLSKFAGVLQRNEWITAPVATFFLEYFLSQ